MDYIPNPHLRRDPEDAAADVAAHILLTRQVDPDAAWLVVEGIADDHLFDPYVDLKSRMACACGKRAVELVSDKLARWGKRDGFVGVVDQDFDALLGAPPAISPVFTTDTHDIETMCLASDEAMDAVLSEHSDRECRRKFQFDTGQSVRLAVLAAAREIGLIRLASLKKGLRLNVAEWDCRRHYPAFLADLKVDRSKLCSFLETTPTLRRDGSSRCCTSSEISTLRAEVNRLDEVHSGCDALLIACGHDACKVLSASIGPTRVLGGDHGIEPNALEQALRLAYPKHVFLSTKLFGALREWQQANRAWTLLRA